MAQDWLVLQLATGAGATALGITTGLQFLPFLLFTPIAGLVADRMSKQRLLQLTNFAMALPAALLAVLALSGRADLWHVYVLAFALGTASAFDAPARQAFVPELVDPSDLSNAVGLNSASFNAARLVGPGLAGLLIAVLGGGVMATGWVIAFNAISYSAPIWTLRRLDASLLDSPALLPARRGAVLEGLRYLRARTDLLLVLAIVFVAGTFGLNFQITSALMATQVYDKGAGEFGLLGSILALGSLTGALLAARRQVVRLRLVVGAGLVFGACVVLAGLMPTYVSFAALTPLTGLSALTLITSANTYMQLNTDAGVRGRVMAIYLMVFMGGTPLGAPLIGWIGQEFGARWTLLGGGLATMVGVGVAGLVFLTLTHVRAPSSLVPRVWDTQAIARARK